jgi:PAS domain S-box-containing protein
MRKANVTHQAPVYYDLPEKSAPIKKKRLFASTKYGVLIVDRENWKIIDLNAYMTRLLGYSRRELLGKIMPDLQASRRNDWTKCEDMRLKTKGGELLDVALTCKTYTENGRSLVQLNIRDLSQLKRSEEINGRERFLRAILENLTDGIVACDAAGKLTLFNGALHDPSDPAAAIPPENWAEQFDLRLPDGKELMQLQDVPLYRALHEGSIRDVEMATMSDEGELLTLLTSGRALLDKDGQKMGAVVVMHDITERKRSEENIRAAETKYRNLVEASAAIVVLHEAHPPYTTLYISPNIKALGYDPAEWYEDPDMKYKIIHPGDQERIGQEFTNAHTNELETELEYRITARDGRIHWWQDKGHFVFDENGNKTGWQAVILDITKTKELEHQLRQSQKLESVGQLAGGIAHDFNNMLTAINGYSDLTLRSLKKNDPLRDNLEEIKKAGLRSAELTQQLLAFSRRQVLQTAVIDLNDVITESVNMLKRLIGEDIQLDTLLASDLGAVIMDTGQFSQVLVNLVVNARDAMSDGGKLIIETSNISLDEAYVQHHAGMVPGNYVLVTVSDNGGGMSEETRERIFEPFFTTKALGKGTGLGLATVYGIIKQSGSNIEVYSELGIGTTFKIYWPRVGDEAGPLQLETAPDKIEGGSETILLLEDEELVRRLSSEILRGCGYTVIEARNGVEALRITDGGTHFDMVVTDVIMPEMGGRQLAGALAQRLPDIPILFTSGYTDNAIVSHGIIDMNSNFLQKPFTPDGLTAKVRAILDKHAETSAAN